MLFRAVCCLLILTLLVSGYTTLAQETIAEALLPGVETPVATETTPTALLTIPPETTEAPQWTVTPTATLGGTALQYISGQAGYQNRQPDHSGIEIQILDEHLNLIGVTTTDSSGVYAVAVPDNAFYWLTASAPLHRRHVIAMQPGDPVPVLVLAGGDFNQDDCIGPGDLRLLVNALDQEGNAADINGDGHTDTVDLAIVTGNYQPDCEATPEPETTPELTPEVEATPEVEQTADVTPELTAEVTPETTPETTPEAEVTAELTPEITPEVTPDAENTEEAAPEVTPEVTAEVTPETTPDAEVTAELTPEITPEIEPTAEATSAPETTQEVIPSTWTVAPPTPTATATMTATPVPTLPPAFTLTFTPTPTGTATLTPTAGAAFTTTPHHEEEL